MHRFHCPELKDAGSVVKIHSKKEIHHLKNVLRLKVGEAISIFDGKGLNATGTILSLEKEGADIQIDSYQLPDEKKITVTLACAIPKRAKFETIIEKTTELGVDEIIPLITKRTEFSAPLDKLHKKNFRYQTVAVNAAKQSQRKTIPIIHPITLLKNALNLLQKDDLALMPCLTGQRKRLADLFLGDKIQTQRIVYFIGPEGDFTDEEVILAKAKGCIPITLGETVLKVDTAAIAVLSFIRLATRE